MSDRLGEAVRQAQYATDGYRVCRNERDEARDLLAAVLAVRGVRVRLPMALRRRLYAQAWLEERAPEGGW